MQNWVGHSWRFVVEGLHDDCEAFCISGHQGCEMGDLEMGINQLIQS